MAPLESQDPLLAAAASAVSAAESAHQAVIEASSSDDILNLTAESVRQAKAVLEVATTSVRKISSRLTIAEFTAQLGEEAREKAEETIEEVILYAGRNVRKARSVIEDHFNIDDAFRMLGPLKQDPNWARDVHDGFNIIALLPVVYMNLVNWFVEPLVHFLNGSGPCPSVQELWVGQSGVAFWWTSMSYFICDLTFVVSLPTSVKSPEVIIAHHIATMCYLIIPKFYPQYMWIMGACMLVEVNTWFLIARRVFNKTGEKPFSVGVGMVKSLRISVVSTCFYFSWVFVRIVLNGFVLLEILSIYRVEVEVTHVLPVDICILSPLVQTILIVMNTKWTIDLARSKFKGRRPGAGL
eukprot:CAMPEP_0194486478 /NCGR_PEP_ID=MMETSP0253-20130528/7110_1 /TAXON_ID=2966 /ORGANISM="Noctiluca scintillans" /LENGTH=352 /DNA_ID=CAMNT_0039326569 /DNA_START=43 /DNA_END=1101 /DNA_ORIENTATION=-